MKIKTRDDEIKNLKYQAKKDDHERIFKSLEIDIDYFKKEHKNLYKKKVLLNFTEFFSGSRSAISSSTLAILNPTAGIVIPSSAALLTSIAILITNEYISKVKITYTKVRDGINVITLFYDKTLKQSMVDKKIDEKEAQELKKIHNHYIDKRSEIMKKTSFKVEDIFGDVVSRDSFSPYYKTKLITFLDESNVNINININFKFFKS